MNPALDCVKKLVSASVVLWVLATVSKPKYCDITTSKYVLPALQHLYIPHSILPV